MKEIVLSLPNEAETDQLGSRLAELLPDNSVVSLIGTLGAGKTRLVRAIARAAGIAEQDVQSPTFVLCHEYRGRRIIFHLDAYRVGSIQEFLDLGVDEYWQGGGLALVEWGDRVTEALPADRLEIEIQITSPESRQVTLRACGQGYEHVLEAVEGQS